MPGFLFFTFAMLCWLLAAPAHAADKPLAGYVVGLALAGADDANKKLVVRQGEEIETKLMMPLHDGDVVFVRDPASRIEIELGPNEHVTVGGATPRFAVEGEITTGDSGWDLLSAVAGIFAGEAEPAPENMVSKGGSLKAPMAVRGANWITPRPSLWLSWQGGKSPYSVTLESGGQERVLAAKHAPASGNFTLAETAAALPEKFTVVVRDAENQALRIRFRVTAALPAGVTRVTDSSVAQALIAAARLTAAGDGAWSIEAAQAAGDSQAGRELRRRIAAGWRLKRSK